MSSTKLSKSGETGDPHLVPDLKEKAFTLVPSNIKYWRFIGFFFFFNIFITSACSILSNAVFVSIDGLIVVHMLSLITNDRIK